MAGLGMAAAGAAAGAPGSTAAGLERTDAGLLLTSGGDTLLLSIHAPIFRFEGFEVGGEPAGPGEWSAAGQGVWQGEWKVATPRAATIRTRVTFDSATGIARRIGEVTLGGGPAARLMEVVLDQVLAVGQSPAGREGWQSYPVFCRSFYMGIEFPAAATRVSGERVVLAHLPGKDVRPGETYRSREAIYGCAAPGGARRAFEAYIASRRPRPKGVHFNYNSWWTSPVPYTEADILKLIGDFDQHLFRPYHTSPDTFTIDMGWARNTTLWGIDPTLFPNGFDVIRDACLAIGSRVGLWISPSGVYGQALDLAWAAKTGYETTDGRYACLGGPRYGRGFRDALTKLVRDSAIGQVKFDGYVGVCESKDHGHAPGPQSSEVIAEGILAVFAALRDAAPEIWYEPTCFGYDPSPWWLPYCNSVIGTFGDDSPPGRVPCPTYREAYTTGRDYFNLIGARDIALPIAAQEVLGIIHQTDEPLQNDAVMCVLRGHQFLSLYVNPAHMTPRRWEFLAALMKWSRARAPILAETRPILPASWRKAGGGPVVADQAAMPREPYGYSHLKEGKGLLCLRNPWVMPCEVAIDPVADLGIGAADAGLALRSVYPDRREQLAISPGAPVRLPLAPYETRVWEIGVGKPASSAPVEIAAPASTLTHTASRLELANSGPAFGPDYTRLLDGPGPFLHLRISGTVTVPAGDRGMLMLLVEGKQPVHAPVVTAMVAGKPVQPVLSLSAAGWKATGLPDPEHWAWVTVALPAGTREVVVDAYLANGTDVASAYLATHRDTPWRKMGKVDGTSLPPPERIWRGASQVLAVTTAADAATTERGDGPIERISGLYLDTLDPVKAEQGWGTLQRNQSVWEKPMQVGGRLFRRGVGVHAPARTEYRLDGRFRRFQCWAGADQATGPTITMEVQGDGRTLWKSGMLTRNEAAQRVDVSVAGVRTLTLLVTDGGNGLAGDHADWCDAILLTR